MSAGAGPLRAFFWVTLPVLRPGILVGALFAFLHSFNEAVVAIFIAGRDASTLPKKMFEAIKSGDLKAAQKEHDLLTRLMQVVGKYLRTHGRGVFCELMKLRGLPVERFRLLVVVLETSDYRKGVETFGDRGMLRA